MLNGFNFSFWQLDLFFANKWFQFEVGVAKIQVEGSALINRLCFTIYQFESVWSLFNWFLSLCQIRLREVWVQDELAHIVDHVWDQYLHILVWSSEIWVRIDLDKPGA